ncbi:hypothetical protein NFJ76_15190 [Citrobacter freundii]|uniref:hypothetical protein n=1 Tax=Citrobacter freundii TaxID=546 RepID=UPI00242B8409|nr:hypothetical protein [Citrobacter freundii]WFW59116.1 hypothetical protein NFJ76_15190 [Citrobacter freundii]
MKGCFELLQTWGVLSQSPEEIKNLPQLINFTLKFKTLMYVAAALALSCGIQLAYMLVTEGPDEAVEPIMLGIASTILLVLSSSDAGAWDLNKFLAILVLVICLPVLYASSLWMKNKPINKNKKQKS